MVLFNYATRELTAKIVYYGPGLCGKTTNLQYIHQNLPGDVRGKMLSLATKTDRTLFFDFLPIDLGSIRGMKTRVQLYTVPGQVFYNETRKLVLKGADGIVFVADSQKTMLAANVESFRNLEENLKAHGMTLAEMPHVIQFNKRDLPKLATIEEMNAAINKYNAPFYESVATTGIGVQDTLKAVVKLVLLHLNRKYDPKITAAAARRATPKPPTPPTPPAAPSPVKPTAPTARMGSVPLSPYQTPRVPAESIPLSDASVPKSRPTPPPTVLAEGVSDVPNPVPNVTPPPMPDFRGVGPVLEEAKSGGFGLSSPTPMKEAEGLEFEDSDIEDLVGEMDELAAIPPAAETAETGTAPPDTSQPAAVEGKPAMMDREIPSGAFQAAAPAAEEPPVEETASEPWEPEPPAEPLEANVPAVQEAPIEETASEPWEPEPPAEPLEANVPAAEALPIEKTTSKPWEPEPPAEPLEANVPAVQEAPIEETASEPWEPEPPAEPLEANVPVAEEPPIEEIVAGEPPRVSAEPPQDAPRFEVDRAFDPEWEESSITETSARTSLAEKTAPANGPDGDEVLLTEVASDPDLFEDESIEVARLAGGTTRVIVVPVEIGEGKSRRRFKLSVHLQLDPVNEPER